MSLSVEDWARLGAAAASAGATTVEEAIAWLVETSQPKDQEDSESSPPPQLSYAARAAQLADDILTRPLTDPQAIELAKVYALLAVEHRLSALITTETTHSPLEA